MCSVTLSKHFLCPAVKTYLPGTYIYVCIDYCGESRDLYMHVCLRVRRVCTRMGGTAFSARGSSHDNPMGVSHRFRGIGFDCCYLDPADEDTGIQGVPDLPRSQSLSYDHFGELSIDYPSAFNGYYSLQSLKFPLLSLDIYYFL